jgi:hypothetical protein
LSVQVFEDIHYWFLHLEYVHKLVHSLHDSFLCPSKIIHQHSPNRESFLLGLTVISISSGRWSDLKIYPRYWSPSILFQGLHSCRNMKSSYPSIHRDSGSLLTSSILADYAPCIRKVLILW